MSPLILKRASSSRSSGEWGDDDYDVVENGVVVGHIIVSPTAPTPPSYESAAARDPVR
jgi:hypothetical protein